MTVLTPTNAFPGGAFPRHVNSFSYIGTIIVKSGQVPSTQANFTMAVSLSDTSLKTVANGGQVTNANGYDIVFFSDSSLTVSIPFGRKKWDGTAGTFIGYVLVASMAVGSIVYVGIGNSSITADQQNRAGCWDSNTVLAMPLGDGTTLDITDWTGANTTTNTNATATSGILDGGAALNGTNAKVDLGSNADLNFGTASFSVEVWASNPSAGGWPISSRSSGSANGWELFEAPGGVAGEVEFRVNTGGTYPLGSTATTGIHQLFGVVVGSTSQSLYLDGALAQTINSIVPASVANSQNPTIALRPSTFWAGTISDIVIAKVARSANWIKTRNNNLSAPSSFYSATFASFTPSSPVTDYAYPGAVQPHATGPVVLSYLNAFPAIPFPQHSSGKTAPQSYQYPGAVQPAYSSGPSTVALVARSLAAVFGRGAVSGASQITGRGFAVVRSAGGASYVTVLAGIGRGKAGAYAPPVVTAAMAARAAIHALGAAAASGALKMTGFGAARTRGYGAPTGAVLITGRGSFAVRAMAPFAAATALTARLRVAALGYGGIKGSIPASGASRNAARASAAGSYRSTMSGRGQTAARASGAPRTSLLLAGVARMAAAGQITFGAAVRFITGRGFMRGGGTAVPGGAVRLSGAMRNTLTLTAGPTGTIGLTGAARSSVSAGAAPTGSVLLTAWTRLVSWATATFAKPKPINPAWPFVRVTPIVSYAARAFAPYTRRAPTLSYVATARRNMQVTDFPAIDAAALGQPIGVDFGAFLPAGVTITGTPTVTVTSLNGLDPNPESIITEGPAVGTIPATPPQNGTGVASTAILFTVASAYGGEDYLLVLSGQRSDGDPRGVSAFCHLPVIQPA